MRVHPAVTKQRRDRRRALLRELDALRVARRAVSEAEERDRARFGAGDAKESREATDVVNRTRIELVRRALESKIERETLRAGGFSVSFGCAWWKLRLRGANVERDEPAR